MIKGEKIRFDIYNILYSIYKFNKNLNSKDIQKIINKHRAEDISFLNNVILNSMRFNFHVSKIIDQYIKIKIGYKEKILLTSAITQIVFLNFKEYAVVNCSVEIAKKLNIYHGLINASLKKISRDKNKLKNINIKFDDLPLWFKSKTDSLTIASKKLFLNNFYKEPSLHIVFKNKEKLKNFDEKLIETTESSGFLVNKKNITTIKSFSKGDWWVQDFSSFFPLQNLQIKDNNIKILDACAAPGGKSFQILSKKSQLTLNDKSESRIKILKSNLNRLNFKAKILNKDFTKFEENQKYDFIIIDAPCSAIGTIRKNPEIFFKSKSPNFKELCTLQKKMLNKASNLLNLNGLILYMVCSFLKNETEDQINNFLKIRSDFRLYKFNLLNQSGRYSKLINKSFMLTMPDSILKNKIDGYFAAYLKKIK
ncbi:RsmB/NOP family class I SAM-dependent RNA methyltransferase [Pelagibacteraceae bacterium]|nr:RsmB/NOP family class I SAM-dependent RNA methyltransferase [Pelagibacteraceae bacterium]